MSGFAGWVHAGGAPADETLLQRMANFLAVRGPDGTQIVQAGGAALCRTLLRTGPLSEPDPGIPSRDGRLWLAGDARLDARDELLEKLRAAGKSVSAGTPDLHLILHAHSFWGERCVEHLLGDFSFAVWDSRARRLWCARDPLGVKPFYYARLGELLVFSNTLDCVRIHPAVGGRLDLRAVADFLISGWNPEPAATIFEQIARLPAAHTLTFAAGTLRVARYWTLPVEEVLRHPHSQDYVAEFRELFHRAVAERLPRGPVAVLMSGGLDSTSVAAAAKEACARRSSPANLRAFTVDYRPLIPDDESSYAARAAAHLGIPLALLSGANCLPYARWDDPLLRQSEPAHEPFLALQYDQLHRAADFSRVALSGDGADVLLLGQAWPYLIHLARRFQFATFV